MATLNLQNPNGASAGTVSVADTVFAVEPNVSAIRQALIAYQANQRQGTHSTKTRAFVSGGGRKPWKQKGTGRARQGSTRSPQWRGGAIIFGPQPRKYTQKLNRKVRRLALCSALSDLAAKNSIHVLSEFGISTPKSKDMLKVLASVVGEAAEKRVLVLLPAPNETIYLSARNLPNVAVDVVGNVNINDLLVCDRLVTTPEALKGLEEKLAQ